MSKKKLTFSLNYRKPKSQYKDSDELMICIRYYHKCSDTDKTKTLSPNLVEMIVWFLYRDWLATLEKNVV